MGIVKRDQKKTELRLLYKLAYTKGLFLYVGHTPSVIVVGLIVVLVVGSSFMKGRKSERFLWLCRNVRSVQKKREKKMAK